MIVQTYTSRAIELSSAIEAVQRGEGSIFPLVVMGTRRRVEGRDLVYGFFFEDKDGLLCDIMLSQRVGLKTLHRQDKVLAFLQTIYPNCIGFEIPYLDEKNLVERGTLEQVRIPRPFYADAKDGPRRKKAKDPAT